MWLTFGSSHKWATIQVAKRPQLCPEPKSVGHSMWLYNLAIQGCPEREGFNAACSTVKQMCIKIGHIVEETIDPLLFVVFYWLPSPWLE